LARQLPPYWRESRRLERGGRDEVEIRYIYMESEGAREKT